MTQKDQIKLIAEGFIILRAEDLTKGFKRTVTHYNIKIKSSTNHNWSNLEKDFESALHRDQRLTELLQAPKNLLDDGNPQEHINHPKILKAGFTILRRQCHHIVSHTFERCIKYKNKTRKKWAVYKSNEALPSQDYMNAIMTDLLSNPLTIED